MGRTALYRDQVPFRSARSEVLLEANVLALRTPDGRTRHHTLHGTLATLIDAFAFMPVLAPVLVNHRRERRFVRMLVLESERERTVLITPPDRGAVAPNVISLPEAPSDAVVVDERAWEALGEWVLGGGRLAAWPITDLARLVLIAAPQFAALIGEVAAQRALEIVAMAQGPLRGLTDVDTALQPLVDAARDSTRAADALVAALAHVAGQGRRRWLSRSR